MAQPAARPEPTTTRTKAHLLGALGIVGQIAAAVSFILVPALTVPPPTTYRFVIAWFGPPRACHRVVAAPPLRSFLVPMVSVPAVTIVLALGGRYLGWTA